MDMIEHSTSSIGSLVNLWRDLAMQWASQLLAELQTLPSGLETLFDHTVLVDVVLLLALGGLIGLVRHQLWRGGRPLVNRLDVWCAGGSSGLIPLRRLLTRLGVIGVHVFSLAGASIAGYGFILVGFSGSEAVQRIASELLNAFILVGLARLVIEGFLEPSSQSARLLPVDTETAKHWSARLVRLAGFVGYGLAFLVPVLATQLPAMATFIKVLVIGFALWGVVSVIRAANPAISEWLRGMATQSRGGLLKASLRGLALTGQWFGIIYAASVAVVAIAAPAHRLVFVAIASAQSVAVLLIAGFLGHWLGRGLSAEWVLPLSLQQRLPLLQNQLRYWMPRLLRVTHLLLSAAAIAVILGIWQLVDLSAWLSSSAGQAVVSTLFGILSVGLLALAAWLFAASWVEDRLNPETGEGEPGAREKTLLALFRNAIAVAIVTIAGMVALSELGINIGPLIAGAGVIGLAIGFGAQKLVQDIITGVFIQLEDAIHKDDFISAAGIAGTVERLSIRSLGLRDLSGTLHVVPFSSVDTVSNYTRDFGYHLAEYGVAYRENIGEVVDYLHQAYAQLTETVPINESVTGPLEVDGVSSLGDSAVNVRVRIRTTPSMQWAVGRAYNRAVKEVFDQVGIEIPFPHMTLYFGEDKSGNAPPAQIALQPDPEKNAK